MKKLKFRPDILLIDDYQNAERNREMVAEEGKIEGYIRVENWLRGNPQTKQLPKWMPIGDDTASIKQLKGRNFIGREGGIE